ncbi:MAG TPA: hypothetical protein VFW62_07715, partial [bacterium]|nr:hypothetical protein [bacterium]
MANTRLPGSPDSSAALLTTPGEPRLEPPKGAAASTAASNRKKAKPENPKPPEEEGEEYEEQPAGFRLKQWLRSSAAMFVSAAVHLVLVILLSFVVVDQKVVQKINEIVAQALEEPEQKEMQVIELEKQLTEVAEQTAQVFSSSPIVGEAGASGPVGMVAAPSMDKALYEQVANADVNIEGIFI